MATSLQRQLAALAAPASSLLLPERRRVSIIFTPEEASKYDKDTFYQIGLDGLKELTSVSPDLFSPYLRSILFSETSKKFERAIEDASMNQKLDEVIDEFLVTLSPYMMLKAALKCMEWLVYRFHIERFNLESILQCIMPYYDTKQFAMIVQIIQLGAVPKNVAVNWQWLSSCIQSATVLRKATLHGNVNAPFVLWLFQTLKKFLKVHQHHCDNLSTYLGFMVSTIVGIVTKFSREFSIYQQFHRMKSKKTVIHVLLNQIYNLFEEILIEGKYESIRNNREVYAVAYVVIATIGITAEENSEISGILGSNIKRIFNLLIKNRNVSLLEETYLLIDMLVHHIYFEWAIKSQKPLRQAVEDLAVVSQRWNVSKVASRLILANTNGKPPKKILAWIELIQLPPETRAEILSKVYFLYKASNTKWAKSLLMQFERAYPSEFQLACDMDPAFADDFTSFQQGKTIMLLVDHPDEDIRAQAVQKLIKRAEWTNNPTQRVSKKKPAKAKKTLIPDENNIAQALMSRFSDQSSKVVCALLKNDLKCLLKIFSAHTLLQGCITVTKIKTGNKPVRLALKKLCALAKKVKRDQSVEKEVLAVLIPFLFPLKPSGVITAKKIICSAYAEESTFLRQYRALAERIDEVTPEEFCGQSYTVLRELKNRPHFEQLGCANALEVTIALLMMKNEEEVVRLLRTTLKVVFRSTSDFPVIDLDFSKCLMMAERKNHVSIELLLTKVLEVEWQNYTTQLEVIKYIWDISGSKNTHGTCMKFLKIFLQKLYPDSSLQFWFWLSSLHKTSTSLRNVDGQAEFHLIRCLQFFPYFVKEFGIPAKMELSNSNAANESAVQSKELHKPLTRSQGKADEIEVRGASKKSTSPSKPYKSNELQLRPNLVKDVARKRVSPTWCLLEILFSQCIQNQSPRVRTLCLQFLAIIKEVPKLSSDWEELLSRILSYEKEIITDSSQAAVLIGRVIFEANLTSVRSRIIKTLVNEDTDRGIFMGLVNICQHIGSLMYSELEPMLKKMVERDPESKQLLAILNCFEATPQSVEILPKLLRSKGSAKIVLKQLNNHLFSESDVDFKKHLFTLMIDCAVVCKIPEIKLMIQRCVQKWEVGSLLVAEEIKKCMGAERRVAAAIASKRNESKNDKMSSSESGELQDWKSRAEVILEFVQGMKRLVDKKLLLPPLFRILKICISLEQQSPVEYLKQLTLTALTICCAEEDDENAQKIDSGMFHVELVIDCLRCSRNPQTHHHALILLNYAAKRFQEQVLHGVMSLFTFMGNSILRQDDTYSTQLIQQTVTTIIPALTKAGKGSHPQFSRTVVSAGIFRVFASALQDIPIHRRLPVFTSLVETLNPEECLWQVLIIIVDNALNRDRKRSNLNADIELAVDLAWSCVPKTVAQNMGRVYEFFSTLSSVYQASVSEEEFRSLKNRQSPEEKAVFDFSRKDCHRDIQIVVHYTLELLGKIASKFSEAEDSQVDYDVILERCLSFSRVVSGLTDDKVFRMIAHRNFEVIEKINAVLEAEEFVRVMSVILERNDFPIKRKVLDMFNLRLSQKIEWFGDLKILLPLLNPLLHVVSMSPESDEVVTLIQTAFLSLKLLAKHLAFNHPDEFVPVFQLTLTNTTHEHPLLCASALLCLGELFCLKSLLLPKLNDVTSAILRAFKASSKLHKFGADLQGTADDTVNEEYHQGPGPARTDGDISLTTAHLLCISTIACMNKMTEQLGALMGSKFLKKALILLLTIDSQLNAGDAAISRKKTFEQRLRVLLKSLAQKIPIRNSLVPLKGAFRSMIDKPKALKAIMSLLKDSLQVTSKPDFVLILPSLCDSFIDEFLAWRDNVPNAINGESISSTSKPWYEDEQELNTVEDAVIDCLISGAVLKMSEGTFRPYYNKLFDWSRENHTRLVTFYRLSAAAAERLKSLFVTFAGYVMSEAVNSLNINVQLTKAILSLFFNVFSNDREGFVTTDRFNAVAKHLVDLMESDYIVSQQIELKILTDGLIQLAVASNDLNRWQHMVDLISSKSHHSNKQVRLNVIAILEAAATELQKDFLPLLPPVVPFLAELMNDDEVEVESATQQMLLKLETIVGEPLQPYFT